MASFQELSYDDKVEKTFTSNIRVLASTVAEDLPPSDKVLQNGKAFPPSLNQKGGLLGTELLKVLQNPPLTDKWTWLEVLRRVEAMMESRDSTQSPTLTLTSKKLNVDKDPFELVPSNSKNIYVLLIGIQYQGRSKLPYSYDAVKKMQKYFSKAYPTSQIRILMEESRENEPPTRNNIISELRYVSQQLAKPGDGVFVYYCGHAGRLDNQQTVLLPSNLLKAGYLDRNNLLANLVQPLPAGVTLTCLWDICHGGSFFDMPYHVDYHGGDDEYRLLQEPNYIFGAIMAGVIIGGGVAAHNAMERGGDEGGGTEAATTIGHGAQADNAAAPDKDGNGGCCDNDEGCCCCGDLIDGLFG